MQAQNYNPDICDIIYHPGDFDNYYLTDEQVELTITTLQNSHENTEKNKLTFDFIRENERLQRERLLTQKNIDIDDKLFKKNKNFRNKFRHWIHQNNKVYSEFYNIINKGKKYE